ncbi:glycine receptor subunit alpha-3-like [Argonauta hians]
MNVIVTGQWQDRQLALKELSQVYYPAEELQLKWQNDTDWHKSMSKIEIDNFNLESITLIEGNISQLGQNWSQIEAKLHLKRNFSLPILAIYITSSILVIVGGLSFWIDSESTAARMSLGLITLLTLITHNSSLHPEKHYFVTGVLGIDIWLIICLIFVFSALFQFIILSHSISSHSTKSKSKKIPSSHDSVSKNHYYLATGEQENSSNRMVIERDVNKYKIKDSEPTNTDTTTNKADRFCRVCFPLAFILTNIIYWMLHFY